MTSVFSDPTPFVELAEALGLTLVAEVTDWSEGTVTRSGGAFGEQFFSSQMWADFSEGGGPTWRRLAYANGKLLAEIEGPSPGSWEISVAVTLPDRVATLFLDECR